MSFKTNRWENPAEFQEINLCHNYRNRDSKVQFTYRDSLADDFPLINNNGKISNTDSCIPGWTFTMEKISKALSGEETIYKALTNARASPLSDRRLT